MRQNALVFEQWELVEAGLAILVATAATVFEVRHGRVPTHLITPFTLVGVAGWVTAILTLDARLAGVTVMVLAVVILVGTIAPYIAFARHMCSGVVVHLALAISLLLSMPGAWGVFVATLVWAVVLRFKRRALDAPRLDEPRRVYLTPLILTVTVMVGVARVLWYCWLLTLIAPAERRAGCTMGVRESLGGLRSYTLSGDCLGTTSPDRAGE